MAKHKGKTDEQTFLSKSIKRTKKEMRRFDPLKEGDPLLKLQCPACRKEFVVGDSVALVPLGPGSSEESRARAREGRPYNAVALPVHWVCATGYEQEEKRNEQPEVQEEVAPPGRS